MNPGGAAASHCSIPRTLGVGLHRHPHRGQLDPVLRRPQLVPHGEAGAQRRAEQARWASVPNRRRPVAGRRSLAIVHAVRLGLAAQPVDQRGHRRAGVLAEVGAASERGVEPLQCVGDPLPVAALPVTSCLPSPEIRSTDRPTQSRSRNLLSTLISSMTSGDTLLRSVDREGDEMTVPVTETVTSQLILDAARTRLLADGYARLSTAQGGPGSRRAAVAGALPLRVQGRHGARPAATPRTSADSPARPPCTPRTRPCGGATSRRATSSRTTSSRATSACSRR